MKQKYEPFFQQINHAKRVMKTKRFWQIQGLNVVDGLYYVLSRVWFNLVYTLVTGIVVYGMPGSLNSIQISYALGSSAFIGFFIWLVFNITSAMKKKNESWIYDKLNSMLLKTLLDVSVLLAFLAFFLEPTRISSNDEVLCNFVIYTSFGEMVLLLLQKVSFAMIKKHFNDGKEENQWKNWTYVKSVQEIKKYSDFTPDASTVAKSKWLEEESEKITVQFLYSKLTMSEVKKKAYRTLITSNHPEGLFKKEEKEADKTDGHTNRVI